MSRIMIEDMHYKLEEINNLQKKYVLEHPKEERDWRTYEQEFAQRIKTAMRDLDPLENEAVSAIHIPPREGHPLSLSLEQRVKLLLIKQLVGKSNRMLANMLITKVPVCRK